jgi:hypothetical protein
MVEPIRRPVHSRPPSFGPRFLLYQRNIENLSKDRAPLGQEIRKSVAELCRPRSATGSGAGGTGGCPRATPHAGAPHPNGPGGEAPVQFDAAGFNSRVQVADMHQAGSPGQPGRNEHDYARERGREYHIPTLTRCGVKGNQ